MKFNRELGLLALSKACIVVKKKKAVVFRFHTEAFTFNFFILLYHQNPQSYKTKPTSRPKQDARFSARVKICQESGTNYQCQILSRPLGGWRCSRSHFFPAGEEACAEAVIMKNCLQAI